MKTETFAAGIQLFAQGDDSEEAYRILNGTVEISVSEDNTKVVLATLGEGDVFGEMGMIEHMPRSATALALTDLTVEVILEEDFNRSLVGSSDIWVPYLSTIFERLRVANERLRIAEEQLEALNAPLEGPKSRRMSLISGGGLFLEPDSDETRSQSALQAQALTSFPFALGRRADLAACVDVFSKSHLLIGDRMPYRVSRSHCVIECEKGVYYIQDRGSKLGTIVNEVALGGQSKERRARLRSGENTLILGPPNSTIRFVLTVPETD